MKKLPEQFPKKLLEMLLKNSWKNSRSNSQKVSRLEDFPKDFFLCLNRFPKELLVKFSRITDGSPKRVLEKFPRNLWGIFQGTSERIGDCTPVEIADKITGEITKRLLEEFTIKNLVKFSEELF